MYRTRKDCPLTTANPAQSLHDASRRAGLYGAWEDDLWGARGIAFETSLSKDYPPRRREENTFSEQVKKDKRITLIVTEVEVLVHGQRKPLGSVSSKAVNGVVGPYFVRIVELEVNRFELSK